MKFGVMGNSRFFFVLILFFVVNVEGSLKASEPCRRTLGQLALGSNLYNRQFKLSVDEARIAFAILASENDPAAMQLHLKDGAQYSDFGDASAEEVASILHYMTNQGYADVNKYLRGLLNSKSAVANDAQVRLMVSCMNRMPPSRIASHSMVYRATTLKTIGLDASYPVGEAVSEAAFMSSSMNQEFVNSSFGLVPSADQVTVQFTIESITGRAIGRGYEKEVLFYPGTRFKVISRDSAHSWDGRPIFIFKLQEEDQ